MEPRPSERGNRIECRRTPTRQVASMEPRPSERGNPVERQPELLTLEASMEPRPSERGNNSGQFQPTHGMTSFNGATSFRTWKLQQRLGRVGHTRGFNGATSFRTWKRLTGNSHR